MKQNKYVWVVTLLDGYGNIEKVVGVFPTKKAAQSIVTPYSWLDMKIEKFEIGQY